MAEGPRDEPRRAMIEALALTALRAGEAIMRFHRSDCAVATKADASPVTAADEAAEAIILADLARLAPGIPVVAEEEVAAGRVPATGDLFFLVDPLDGTREFVAHRDDFTVNIALVEGRAPSFGIVHAPAHGVIHVGDVVTGQAWTATVAGGRIGERRPLRVRAVPAAGLSAVASRSHRSPLVDAYLAGLPVAETVCSGSSLKLCLVAEGRADIYPRFSPTCEWDIAAGDAVLRSAGGILLDADGAPMAYAKPAFLNDAFVAAGGFTPPSLAPVLDPR